MRKKGILFDMDGTLINTYENYDVKPFYDALRPSQQQLLKQLLKEHVHSFAEMEKRALLKLAKDDADSFVRQIRTFLCRHYQDAALLPRAAAFLQYLKEKGYALCLCTNNADDIIHFILKEKGLESLFRSIITSQQVTHSKPHPQMYLKAMEALSLPAEECIVFEDSEDGIRAAKAAGAEVIAVGTKERKDCRMSIRDYRDARLYDMF